jgi:hypothetical protein
MIILLYLLKIKKRKYSYDSYIDSLIDISVYENIKKIFQDYNILLNIKYIILNNK